MAKCYIAEKAIEYYAEYIKDVQAVGVPKHQNLKKHEDNGIGAAVVRCVDKKTIAQSEVQGYLE